MEHILIVEDDPALGRGLVLALESAERACTLASDCAGARRALAASSFDLAIFDINLPDGSGLTLLEETRAAGGPPVILLTANDLETDIVTGLTLGADDYLTKPFNPLELLARVKTQLRRYTRYNAPREDPGDEIDIRGLTISRASHRCALYGREIALTPLEFSILWYLCAHQGRVVSSEELFEAVWGERYIDANNTVMTHIARLREKLGEPSRRPKFIKTVWGVGYTIEK